MNDKIKSIVRNVAVDNGQILNTLDHAPVTGTFKMHSKKTINQTIEVMCKSKWERCDRSVYRDVVRDNLLPFDAFSRLVVKNLTYLRPLSHLTAVLKQATMSSIPKFKPEVTVRQVQSRPWSARIQSVIKESHLAWWDWRNSGSPTDPMHDTVIRRRTTRNTLRKEQHQEAAARRRDYEGKKKTTRKPSTSSYKISINTQIQNCKLW